MQNNQDKGAPDTAGTANATDDADEQRRRDYRTVADALLAGVFATAVSATKLVTAEKIRNYRDQLLEDYGAPTDPLHRLLIETVVVAHARVLDLQAKAAAAKKPETIKALSEASAKLMSEMRRTFEVLTRSKAATTPKQSNVTFRVVRGEEDQTASAA